VLIGATTAALPLMPSVNPDLPMGTILLGFAPFYSVYVVALVLLRFGRARQAAWLTVFGTLLFELLVNAFNTGIEGQALVSFLNLTLVAGFTIGPNAAVATTAVTVVSVLAHVILRERGALPAPFVNPTLASSALSTCLTMAATGGIVVVVLKHVREALVRERKALRRLHQSVRMDAIGRFSSGLAHDFNNVLTTILRELELAERGAAESPSSAFNGERVRDATLRAASLTKKMLNLDGAASAEVMPTDVYDCIRRLESSLRTSLPPGVKLLLLENEATVFALADPVELEQILLNLVNNARDAVGENGTISIEVEQGDSVEEGFVAIHVRDDGIGMAAEVRDRVFEPFFTTRRSSGGNGLGLSGAYALARRQGAKISVQSEPNEGACFSVFLRVDHGAGQPVRVQNTSEPAAAIAPNIGQSGEHLNAASVRILLVDDDSAVRNTVALMARELGYDVTSVDSAEAALSECGKNSAFDLVISDVGMPKKDGYQLLEELRSSGDTTPAILMSGFHRAPATSNEMLMPYKQLAKPFEMDDLALSIRGSLSGFSAPSNLVESREAG
jgi:signal transduction histidine kinase/ActR/RegA family two-component response regulator